MKQKPLISVILPVYNSDSFLEESIKSILNQTMINFELIIINDGSTDKSLEICENFKKIDYRILILSNKHKGLTKSLNEGINFASGKYIARQDADDLSDNRRFEKQIKWFEKNPGSVLCGTNTIIKDQNNKKKKNKVICFEHSKIIKRLEYTNCFAHSSVMFLKDIAIKVDKYDENLLHSQDYDLWCKMSLVGKIGNLREKLIILNERADSISKKNSDRQFIDFINSSLKYRLLKKGLIGLKDKRNFQELLNYPIAKNHKIILQYLYNDKLKEKKKFSDLNLEQKIYSFRYYYLYIRKILNFLFNK